MLGEERDALSKTEENVASYRLTDTGSRRFLVRLKVIADVPEKSAGLRQHWQLALRLAREAHICGATAKKLDGSYQPLLPLWKCFRRWLAGLRRDSSFRMF